MVEVHYSFREDLGSIPRENSYLKGKPDYIWKELVFFPDNRKGDTFGKPKTELEY